MNICITGASKGLGAALCKELTRRGHAVWGIARDGEALKELERMLPPGSFGWCAADIGEEESMNDCIKAMDAARFVPHIVVLNASVMMPDLRQTYDHVAGGRTIDVNLKGTLACIDRFLPHFLHHHRGRFVAITSTAALRPSTLSAAYSASKAGLRMALRSLRLRYQSEGISFGDACLGPIATDMWEGKKNWLVPSSYQAANRLASFIESNGRTLYYPFLTTTLLRLSLWMPDRWFAAASRKALK